jgi:hypothetical protein
MENDDVMSEDQHVEQADSKLFFMIIIVAAIILFKIIG